MSSRPTWSTEWDSWEERKGRKKGALAKTSEQTKLKHPGNSGKTETCAHKENSADGVQSWGTYGCMETAAQNEDDIEVLPYFKIEKKIPIAVRTLFVLTGYLLHCDKS